MAHHSGRNCREKSDEGVADTIVSTMVIVPSEAKVSEMPGDRQVMVAGEGLAEG
jgi:hypothetical protein